jgi:hypothetical protein
MYKGLTNFKERVQAPYNPIKKKEWQNNFWVGENKEYVKHKIF